MVAPVIVSDTPITGSQNPAIKAKIPRTIRRTRLKKAELRNQWQSQTCIEQTPKSNKRNRKKSDTDNPPIPRFLLYTGAIRVPE